VGTDIPLAYVFEVAFHVPVNIDHVSGAVSVTVNRNGDEQYRRSHLVQETKCKESLKEGLLRLVKRACKFAQVGSPLFAAIDGICYWMRYAWAVHWGV